MTLGVIKSAPADRDNVFSHTLRTHAKSLELNELMPVGEWDYGQGIRRARGQQFYWYLDALEFLPLGLNHPTTLVTTEEERTLPPQKFSTDLVSVFPQLADWAWTLLPADHSWFKQSHTSYKQETCLLSAPLGWEGFAELSSLTAWGVQLSEDVFWVAATEPLPSEGLAAPGERSWLKVFLTKDVLGPEGRLQELRARLSRAFPQENVSGLSVTLSQEKDVLASRGLACEAISDKQVRLHFPLSFLQQDLDGIVQLFAHKG